MLMAHSLRAELGGGYPLRASALPRSLRDGASITFHAPVGAEIALRRIRKRYGLTDCPLHPLTRRYRAWAPSLRSASLLSPILDDGEMQLYRLQSCRSSRALDP